VRANWPSGATRRWPPGIAADRLVLDPGIGFAKTAEHNWALLGAWSALDRSGSRCCWR
jgi:dihydropteroate synthase